MSLNINHNAGFFSCCTVKLKCIIDFINNNKKLPSYIDCSNQLLFYKKQNEKRDITYDYFKHYNETNNFNIKDYINFGIGSQYKNFKFLDFNNISPVIKKYFSPSKKVLNILKKLVKKYNIDYENTIAIYFRGTDKKKEINISKFEDFYKKLKHILSFSINKNKNIIIQTDSAQFLDYMKKKKLKNIITFEENLTSYSSKGIHKENDENKNYNNMFYLFSIFLIISKCKYIICGPSNCSLWISLYRGNNINVFQKLNEKWISNIKYNIALHTFGDSHAREPWNKIPPIYNIKINHIGALLCYSFGKEVLKRINISDPKYNVKEGDYVCFSLGEIDCRCHVHKHIHKINYKDIIKELVENYMKAIIINKNLFKKINICVLSLPPIIDKNLCGENKDFPFLGTNEQRRAYISFFNEQLKNKCLQNNFIFLNIYKYYLNNNKFMKEELRGKNVHIGNPKFLVKEIDKYKILKKILI